LKFLNLLISFILISSGVLSCTTPDFVGNRKKIINQQFVDTINQNGNYRQVMLQPEKENIASQAVSVNVPTKKIPSSTTNTKNKQSDHESIGKEHVDNLPGLEQQYQMKLNQVGLAHLALGIAFAERNLTDQAICEFQSAIEENPYNLESHVRLGTAYGIKGMADEAKSEFKKAMNIDLNEAVAKIVFDALPVAENTKKQKDLFKAHINLGNAYKKEAKLKEAQLVFEKALALKPEHPIARKSLSEIYFILGTSHLENQEYDNAIVEFNKVSGINPDFPQIKVVLEKAHYNLGIIYAENRKLDKAIIELSKAKEISHNYAMLGKNNLTIISKGKKAISDTDKRIHSGRSHSGENAHDSTNNEVRKEGFHEVEQGEESLQNQMPHQIDVAEEMILAGNNCAKETAYDESQVGGQGEEQIQKDAAYTQTVRTAETDSGLTNYRYAQNEGFSFQDRKANELDFMKKEQNGLIQTREEKGTNNPKPCILDQKMEIYKKSIKHFSLSNEGVVVTLNRPGEKRDNNTLPDKLLSAKEINNKAGSYYRVYAYNITRNDKAETGINEAIKKYEDAARKNPYDNNAFLNLAHAYYCKAMYLDDAIARREDAPEGNQNVSVKRYYLNDDAGSGKNSETGFAEQTNTFGNNIAFRNRSGNMYEEMFREAIIEYKNALRINPNSSNSLYGLAFSFSIKGSSPGVALKSKNNSEGILFGY